MEWPTGHCWNMACTFTEIVWNVYVFVMVFVRPGHQLLQSQRCPIWRSRWRRTCFMPCSISIYLLPKQNQTCPAPEPILFPLTYRSHQAPMYSGHPVPKASTPSTLKSEAKLVLTSSLQSLWGWKDSNQLHVCAVRGLRGNILGTVATAVCIPVVISRSNLNPRNLRRRSWWKRTWSLIKKVLHLATMFLKAAAKICDLESLDE